MTKGRLEAFSDGVIAILITIMVLELRVPPEASLAALRPLIPVLVSYILSFVLLGIYWNNHHHLFQAVRQVNGPVLWANSHLLFWLSLVPFVTAWMGKTSFAVWPVALYGIVLWCSALAYFLLVRVLIGHHGDDSYPGGGSRKGFKRQAVAAVLYCGSSPFVPEPLVGLRYLYSGGSHVVPPRPPD